MSVPRSNPKNLPHFLTPPPLPLLRSSRITHPSFKPPECPITDLTSLTVLRSRLSVLPHSLLSTLYSLVPHMRNLNKSSLPPIIKIKNSPPDLHLFPTCAKILQYQI
jgi:hypothetical protein